MVTLWAGNLIRSFDFKQVIAVRADLGMSVGKTSAQVAHASVSALEKCRKHNPTWAKRWLQIEQRKIVLGVESVKELKALEMRARKLGLPTAMVKDMGLTEVPPGTLTALGIGPAPSDLVDRVTGSLPLL